MPKIEDYRFGRVVVEGEEHTKDVIVLPNRVVAGWWRKEGHGLVIEDLEEVLDELPPNLILGIGNDSRMRPDPGAIRELERRGVKVEALPTGEAVRLFAGSDPATTAAALHLTC